VLKTIDIISFRLRTSGVVEAVLKTRHFNSNRMRTYRKKAYNSFILRTYKKLGGGGTPLPSAFREMLAS
jgi:hypothetical protein